MAVDVDFLPGNSTNNINTNFERVKTALQGAVGRGGDLPNQMNADLDMNSNDLLNVGILQASDISIDGGEVTGVLQRAETAADTAVAAAAAASALVADGDKGDITISSGVWTIDPNTVTIAKLATEVQELLGGSADISVPTRAALKAADTIIKKAVILTEAGRAGIFVWDGSDLSSKMVNRTVTSTAVNSSTELITSVAHQLDTGNAVVVTTAVNGLSLNTKYYVIRVDADNFRLATSYANARAGTAIDLTNTTNFTVKRLSDDMEGVYITSNGGQLDGTTGAWTRSPADKKLNIRWFGAVDDNTVDSRQAIMGAFELAAALNASVLAPAGNWGFNGEIYVYRNTPLVTEGPEKTIFKNLSTTGRGMYFERHGAYGVASGTANTSFIAISGGFTLDQNNSTGDGLTFRAQHTTVNGQVIVRNQGTTGFATKLDACTLINIDYLSLITCKNGLRIVDCYYPRIGKFAGEVTAGDVISAVTSTSIHFDDCYIDPGSTTDARTQLSQFVNCTDISFNKLTGEIDNSGTYSGLGLILIDGCSGFFVKSGRFLINTNAYSSVNNKAIFLTTGFCYNIVIENFAPRISGGTAVIYFVRSIVTASNQVNNLTISKITTDFSNSGSRYLFYNDTNPIVNVNISLIRDVGNATQIYYRGTNVLISQFAGAITNDSAADSSGVSTTTINCNGTKTGLSGMTRLNSTV